MLFVDESLDQWSHECPKQKAQNLLPTTFLAEDQTYVNGRNAFFLFIIPTSASCFATPDIIHSFICWTSTCLHLVTHLLETFVPIHCSPVGYSFTEPLTVSSVMFTLISYTQLLTHQRHPRLLWSSILIYSHLLFAHLMNKHLQHSLSRYSHQFIHHTYLFLHHSFINTYPPFLSFNTYYPLPNLSLLYMYLHLLNAHSLISSMLHTLSSIIQISVHSAYLCFWRSSSIMHPSTSIHPFIHGTNPF